MIDEPSLKPSSRTSFPNGSQRLLTTDVVVPMAPCWDDFAPQWTRGMSRTGFGFDSFGGGASCF